MKKFVLLTTLLIIASFLLLIGCGPSWEDTVQEAQGTGQLLQTSRITPLLHNDGTWQLIVAPHDFGNAQTSLTIEGIDGEAFRETQDGEITSTPLQSDIGYIVTVERDGELVRGSVRLDSDYWLSVDGEPQPRDSRNFETVRPNGNVVGEFESVFQAMESTFRRDGTSVKEYGIRTVFVQGESDAIYLFQHTRFIRVVDNEDEAREFLDNHPFTHAINSDGSILCNSYRTWFDLEEDAPDEHMWEPNSGGYTYKVPYIWNGFTRATKEVELSQARFRKSERSGEDGQGFNAYIFFAVQNAEFTVDVGIMSGWAHEGDWHVFLAGGIEMQGLGVITGSEYVDGSYFPHDDLRIETWIRYGEAFLKVTNLTTGEYLSSSVQHDDIGGPTIFISATSFVPDNLSYYHTPDWRNGGYLLNVVYRNKYLQRPGARLDDFDSFLFWMPIIEGQETSDTARYFFLYNDDTCRVEFLSDDDGNPNGEIINIDYRFWEDRELELRGSW